MRRHLKTICSWDKKGAAREGSLFLDPSNLFGERIDLLDRFVVSMGVAHTVCGTAGHGFSVHVKRIQRNDNVCVIDHGFVAFYQQCRNVVPVTVRKHVSDAFDFIRKAQHAAVFVLSEQSVLHPTSILSVERDVDGVFHIRVLFGERVDRPKSQLIEALCAAGDGIADAVGGVMCFQDRR